MSADRRSMSSGFRRPAIGEDRSHPLGPRLRPPRLCRVASSCRLGDRHASVREARARSAVPGPSLRRPATRVKASRFFWSLSGSVWRYFCVVWICACPIRSITPFRSAPPASSHDACACRRSCIRTPKSRPEALTAGSHTRVRKALREIGVPPRSLNRSRPARCP